MFAPRPGPDAPRLKANTTPKVRGTARKGSGGMAADSSDGLGTCASRTWGGHHVPMARSQDKIPPLTGGGEGEGHYSAALAEAAIIESLCRCRLSNSIIARNKWGRASRPPSMTGGTPVPPMIEDPLFCSPPDRERAFGRWLRALNPDVDCAGSVAIYETQHQK